MKTRMIAMVTGMTCILFVALNTAIALASPNWIVSDYAKVTKISIMSCGDIIPNLAGHTWNWGSENNQDCDGAAAIAADDPNKNQLLSLLLTAKATGQEVQLWVYGCHEYDASPHRSYPWIRLAPRI